jgi:glyoxylase-like metal-dependent hydrolase (beta-lactamase superfamily II)
VTPALPFVQVNEYVHTFDLPRPEDPPPGAPPTREPVGVHLLDDDLTVLVGTGFSSSADELLSYLCDVDDLDGIVVEHGDQDHFEALPDLLEAYPAADVAIPADDAPSLEQVDVEPDVHLDHHDEIWGLRAVHVPGHTPGNMSFVHEPTDTLLVGDTVVHASSVVAADEDWSHSFALPKPVTNHDDEAARVNVRTLADYDFDVALTTHGHNVTFDAKARFERMLHDAGL